MGVRPSGIHTMSETYEHLGGVQTHSVDLHARRKELMETRRVVVAPADALVTYVREFDAPPPIVWEWFVDPVRRNLLGMGAQWSVIARPGGRAGPGARNHCAHGKCASTETILDWLPFDYVTAEMAEGKMVMRQTVRFEPIDGGKRTRVTDRLTTSSLPLPRVVMAPMFKAVMGKYKYEEKYDMISRMLSEHYKPDEQPETR